MNSGKKFSLHQRASGKLIRSVLLFSALMGIGWFFAQILLVFFAPTLFEVLARFLVVVNILLFTGMSLAVCLQRFSGQQDFLQHIFETQDFRLPKGLLVYGDEPKALVELIFQFFDAVFTEVSLMSDKELLTASHGERAEESAAYLRTLIEPILLEGEYIGKIEVILPKMSTSIECDKELLGLIASQVALRFKCRALVEEILYRRACITQTRSTGWRDCHKA